MPFALWGVIKGDCVRTWLRACLPRCGPRRAAPPRRRSCARAAPAKQRKLKATKMAPRRLILDGSMGHTLKQRGLSDSFAEAAYANLRQPELVTSVHSEVSTAPRERGTHTTRSQRRACVHAVRGGRRRRAHHQQFRRHAVRALPRPCPVGPARRVGGTSAGGARGAAARGGTLRQRGGCHGHRAAGARRRLPATAGDVLPPRGSGVRAGHSVSQSVRHYHTPSREHMAHTHPPPCSWSEQEMAETYGRLVAELSPRVDLFLAETLSCASEAC